MVVKKTFVHWLVLVVFVSVLAIAGVIVYSSDLDFLTSIGSLPQKGGKPDGSGSVWEDLKERGLQGEHHTLNIHGKKIDFNKQDCTVTPDPETGEYSNNIFVPSYSADSSEKNQIIMVSGHAKGKWASTNQVYGVRDACTAPFDGDAAELVLPPNEKGYYVTARVLGKPTDNPEITLEGDLLWVQDENGNDLLILGLVTDKGFLTPSTTLTRTKGKVKAVDITGLFEWNGSVCYFSPDNYCYDDQNQYICVDQTICCEDSDLDGVYDVCTDPLIDAENTEYCPEGYQLLTVGCREYVNEWVFNIGDFVGYMWDTHTDGNFKLANIRFYPVK